MTVMPTALRYPVKQTLQVDSMRVVLLDIPTSELLNENIYGLDESGQIAWQVERVPRTTENAPFVSMAVEDGLLRAVSWDGVVVWLNPSDGSVQRKAWYR
jgi:hypothetical protein